MFFFNNKNLDPNLINKVNINLSAVKKRAAEYATRRAVKKEHQVAWLMRAITCIDLTTLAGDDAPSNVHKLCFKAANPVRSDLLKSVGFHDTSNFASFMRSLFKIVYEK